MLLLKKVKGKSSPQMLQCICINYWLKYVNPSIWLNKAVLENTANSFAKPFLKTFTLITKKLKLYFNQSQERPPPDYYD